ncbi:major facilitator transporter [Amycolatopsis mediterranei S699]|uniref:Major facilitator transporter n=3 Tax=Amycolatopsis mediterranei TaxID=33910 RepID=A0A0H3DHB8_AMYMU|nr:MFS transporter [Amycolatopsis mediterranei]ADJ50255.1 major facilitator transporter [Amycolatopsis mediterranei U32]AEK47254.1 major facilitator transporter [Amycolatopsis mediterranei S699]AFO81960.1 major facilitator transporter [Amycolatopsis mediterranei S699]AGT89089.1 major facilitator transporter [Amycolatopsis mediterranei RB]KDO08361.1 MFS transporter [Amycolatopsis mediterranei]
MKGLWGNRDFRLLWTGETTSMLGSMVASTALPLVAVVTLQASTFQVALLTAAAWLPWLVIGLPAGAWVDRLAKRPIMLICNTVSMLVFGSVPLAAAFGALSMPFLLAAALLGGIAKVFFTLAYRAYVPALVGAGELLEANAKLQGSESATEVAGPGLAGLLAQAFGPVSGILADAISFGVSVGFVRAIRTRETVVPAERTPLRGQIAEGLRFVVNDRYLRTLTVFGAVSNIALTGYGSIQIVFLSRTLGAPPGLVGLVLAVAATGGVLGAALVGRLGSRLGTARAFLVCEAFVAPMGLLGPLSRPGWGLVLYVLALFGVCTGLIASNILTTTFRQQYCPPELFGRINSSAAIVNYGTIPLAGVLGGALGEAIGVRETLWVMAGVLLAALVLLAPLAKLRDFPVRAAGRPPLPQSLPT